MICPRPNCEGWVRPVDIVKLLDREYYDVVHKCDKCGYTEYKLIKEGIINNKIGVPFEKLYGTNPYEVYKIDIENFFKDKIIDKYQYYTRPDGIKVAKGFIWVAHHDHFATLTVEPMDGNQFEIAVRFPHETDSYIPFYKYSGYSICNIPYVLIGKDTGGH